MATRLLCAVAAMMTAGVALAPAAGAQTLSDDASLGSLSIESDLGQTRMFPLFDPDVDRYDVAVPSGETEVTVKVKTNDPEASVVLQSIRSGRCCREELDYDANTDAYTLELRTDGETHLDIDVTAEDGTEKQYDVRIDVASRDEKGWRVYNDVPMDRLVVPMDRLVDEPQLPSHYIRGLWADDSRVLTTARRHGTKDGEFYLDQKLYAFDAADSSRLPDEEFVLSGGPYAGIWSDGTFLWALDTDGTLRAYNLSDGSEITGWSVDLSKEGYYDTREVYEPRGIWSDGDTLWVTGKDDADNAKGFAFELPKGCNSCRKSSLDFELSGDNDNPWGITGNDDTWWVTEVAEGGWTADTRKIYAYNRSDGSRDTDKDIDLLQLTTTHLQQLYYGLAATDTIMYVAEYITGRVYSFNMPGVSGPVAPALISSDATLSSLSLNNASLSPSFSSSQTRYEANVEPDVTSTTVTATPNHPSARAVVKFDGVIAANGVVGPLVVGINTIIVEVTAGDGFKQTYTVEVGRRAKSTDATLQSLRVTDLIHTSPQNEVTLTPTFHSATLPYTATVSNPVDQVNVTATPFDLDHFKSIEINGTDVTESNHALVVDLVAQEVGDPVVNTITVVVTAENGDTETYTVTVTRERALSDVAALRDLALMYADVTVQLRDDSCDDTTTDSYDANVPYGAESLIVQFSPCDAKAQDVNAFIENDDVTPREEVDPTNVVLAQGVNTLAVEVIAENGTTKQYAVEVVRAAPSDDATLDSLWLDPGTLVGSFDPESVNFTAKVGHGDATTVLTILPTDGRDSPTVVVEYGGTVQQIQGEPGLRVVDGTEVSRFLDDDNAQKPNRRNALNYTIPLAAPVGSVPSETKVTIEVTAEDGIEKNIYVVDIERPVKPDLDDATLETLDLKNAKNNAPVTFDNGEVFDAGDISYTATVGNDATQIVVVAIPENHDAASVQLQVDGSYVQNASQQNVDKDDLAVGVTVDLTETNRAYELDVEVTAEDGNTTETYTVFVTRDDPPPSGVTTLDSLLLRDLSQTPITLSPLFDQDVKDAGTTEFRASVDHGVTKLEVIAAATDGDVAVTVNEMDDGQGGLAGGTPWDEGGFVPLDVNENIIRIVVTARDSTTETYTVTVDRDVAPDTDDATLRSLTLKQETIDLATFDLESATTDEAGAINFTVSVANAVEYATLRAVAKSANAGIVVTLRDTTATADAAVSLDVPLAVRANEITVVVTAEDDTATKTYKVTVNRARPTPSGNTGGGNSNRPGTSSTNIGGGSSTPIGGSNTGSNTESDDTDDEPVTTEDDSDTVTPLDDVDDADADHRADINELHGLGLFTGTLCQTNSLCPNDPMARWIAAVWLVRLLDGDDPAPVTESRFADVHASTMWEDAVWYAPHVERLAELEITVGCSEDPLKFCPDVMLRKAQVASWIARAFDLDSASSQGFVDAVGSVHEANINVAVAAGVMEGCSTDPKNFCLDDTVTRGEMASYVNEARKVESS